jgi:hypothetical protein
MTPASWLKKKPGSGRTGCRFRCEVLVVTLAAAAATSWAQSRLGSEVRPPNTDVAVLESNQLRKDLSCQVRPQKPYLGFDLRFHAYYRVTVPNKALADAGGSLQLVARVRPAANSEEPVYLTHRLSVPELLLESRSEGMLTSEFELGFGRYRVDWMMRDNRGRVCSSHWNLEVRQRGETLPLTLAPNMVSEGLEGPLNFEPSAERDVIQPLHVKVLLNVSPPSPRESILQPEYAEVLLSILRAITREPRVSHVTLVAFNLIGQKITYRHDAAKRIDFVELARSLQTTTAGTVSYGRLQDPLSETQFVTNLLIDQLSARTGSEDAIIILGPKVTIEKKVPLESLREAGAPSCPIFYLNYNPDPIEQPFADAIGSALKAFKGILAYNIVLPRDLGVAMKDILFRMSRSANAHANIASPVGRYGGAEFQQ